MKKLSIFFTIFVATFSSYFIATSAVSTTYRINVNINPGAVNTSTTPPRQDFRFAVTIAPNPPQGTKAVLEAALAGSANYTNRGNVPFVLPGQVVSSNRQTFDCGLNAKVRIKLEIPGAEPEYSADFPFTTQTCSGGSGQQLGANQKIIPVATGGDYLVTVNLSPSNTGSTTALISGDVANRTNPQKPITRVGLEIKEKNSTTYTDRGNIGNTSQGSGVAFTKTFDRLEADTMYDVRVWVTSGTEKKYTEPFSFQTKKSDGTGGQTSNLALVTIRLSGSSTEENTTVLFTTQIPGVFARYQGKPINFGIETETEGSWETIHVESSTIQTGPDVIRDKQISSRDEEGWGFTCGNIYKIRGFFSLRENDSDPQPTRFVSPELTISTRDCDSAVTGGSNNEPIEPGDNTYVFLTPLPLGEGLASQDSVVIGAVGDGGILGILQRIFTLLLITAIVLAVVFMIIGGARYATGDTLSGKMGGRQIITNAITGLLFALLAWLLLNIVNPDLLRFTLSIPSIGQKLTKGTGNTSENSNTVTGEGCDSDISDEECFDLITADEPTKRAALAAAKIDINVGPCPRFGASGCTNVGLLSETTLNNLIQVKEDCNCAVKITGGTEYWLHGSGGNHKKFIAVDLDINNRDFNTFIRSKKSLGSSSVCNGRFEYKGLLFCDENIAGNPPHWHVDTVTGSGSGPTTSGGPIKFENIGVGNNGVWGKASRQQITTSEISALVNAARSKSWYGDLTGPNAKILAAIIMVESSGDPTKVRTEPDGRKSCGLGQILTETAKGLDSSLRGKSVEEICTELKNPSYNIRLANQLYNSQSGEFKKKVAAYNGGGCSDTAGESCSRAAVAPSQNCDGLMRFECPWDSDGCYDKAKPNDRPSNTSCQVNTGYEVTRFYVDKVKKISDQL